MTDPRAWKGSALQDALCRTPSVHLQYIADRDTLQTALPILQGMNRNSTDAALTVLPREGKPLLALTRLHEGLAGDPAAAFDYLHDFLELLPKSWPQDACFQDAQYRQMVLRSLEGLEKRSRASGWAKEEALLNEIRRGLDAESSGYVPSPHGMHGANSESFDHSPTTTFQDRVSTSDPRHGAQRVSIELAREPPPVSIVQRVEPRAEPSADMPCTWAQLKFELKKINASIYTDAVRDSQTLEAGLDAICAIREWGKEILDLAAERVQLTAPAKRLLCCIFVMQINAQPQTASARWALLQWFPARLNPEIEGWKGSLLQQLRNIANRTRTDWLGKDLHAKATALENS